MGGFKKIRLRIIYLDCFDTFTYYYPKSQQTRNKMAHPKTIQVISLEDFTKNSLEEAFEFTDMDETCRNCPYSSFDDRNIHSASEEPNDAPECSGNASECLLLTETEDRAEEEYDNMIFKLEYTEVA